MLEEKVLLDATLCFPVRDNKILLGMKRKKIGQGRWNGYGGGIEENETPEQSIIRELEEEAGVKVLPSSLEKVAIIDFHNTKTDGTVFVCRVHTYLLRQWDGEFKSTDEMARPTWFSQDNLPLDGMMPADRIWLPIVLEGRKIVAKAWYGPFQKTLLGDVEIEYIDTFC